MKVAHITLMRDYIPGIYKKIKERSYITKNKKIDFYIINMSLEFQEDNIKIIKTDNKLPRNNLLQKIYYKLNNFNVLLQQDFQSYDWIILRYPMGEFGWKNFLNKYGNKIISEHHTNEEAELLSTGRFIDKLKYIYEKIRSKSYLEKVRGIIAVTEEIRQIELKKVSSFKPSATISNGIDIKSINFTKFKKFDGKELNLIFVASFFSPWHGLDIFLDSMEKYKGNIKINLHLVGDVSKSDRDKIEKINKNSVNAKVILYGRKDNEELDKIFANSTIAISTLALSRTKMKEACPLKTREYIARGIPFIYGYKDTDLMGNEDFSLKIEEENIGLEKIIDFANKVSQSKDISYEMRQFALEKLDWKIKIQQLFDFLSSLEK